MLSAEQDIAILNAPNGQPHSPIKGIEFRDSPLRLHEVLYSAPAELSGRVTKPFYSCKPTSGVVSSTYVPHKVEGVLIDVYVEVQGMKSFRGASGTPVWDENGLAVGIIVRVDSQAGQPLTYIKTTGSLAHKLSKLLTFSVAMNIVADKISG